MTAQLYDVVYERDRDELGTQFSPVTVMCRRRDAERRRWRLLARRGRQLSMSLNLSAGMMVMIRLPSTAQRSAVDCTCTVLWVEFGAVPYQDSAVNSNVRIIMTPMHSLTTTATAAAAVAASKVERKLDNSF